MLIPRREHVTRHMLTTNQQCYTALEDVKLPELQIAELNGKIIERRRRRPQGRHGSLTRLCSRRSASLRRSTRSMLDERRITRRE